MPSLLVALLPCLFVGSFLILKDSLLVSGNDTINSTVFGALGFGLLPCIFVCMLPALVFSLPASPTSCITSGESAKALTANPLRWVWTLVVGPPSPANPYQHWDCIDFAFKAAPGLSEGLGCPRALRREIGPFPAQDRMFRLQDLQFAPKGRGDRHKPGVRRRRPASLCDAGSIRSDDPSDEGHDQQSRNLAHSSC